LYKLGERPAEISIGTTLERQLPSRLFRQETKTAVLRKPTFTGAGNIADNYKKNYPYEQ